MAITAVVYLWIFGIHRHVACEGRFRGLLLSYVSGSHVKIEKILDFYHQLHGYYICRDGPATDALVSSNIPQLVSLTSYHSKKNPI